MPHAIASSDGLGPVEHFDSALRQLLQRAHDIKPDGRIEPALKSTDFGGEDGIARSLGDGEVRTGKEEQNASVETALRRIFYEVLASTDIEQPQFGKVWSLLDITTILSDLGFCDYNLPFWLVEELLESQTLDGCRKVFDYLESRREIMIANHYQKKYLTILRACNDLLKRLSRAEDTVFCGRVFIYLFSTLTFGDRSSVNLRGEFHLANVTTFDDTQVVKSQDGAQMDIDSSIKQDTESGTDGKTTITITEPSQGSGVKTVPLDAKAKDSGSVLDYDALYPIFWSLQGYFSRPTSLFETEKLDAFKKGLEATLLKFKQVQKDTDTSSSTIEEKSSLKRKRESDDGNSKAAFNPKYLTSRDLFELEISDLAFRRHILVQGLILIDFLLSQTPKAKSKLENSKNKAVMWSFTLDEEQTAWSEKMRNDIAAYLQQGAEGKFYLRMVDTILSRDKNWVQWKADSCQSFSRDPVPPSKYAEARTGAKRATAIKRPKNNPLGALDLGFLSESQTTDALERLRDPARSGVPAMDAYRMQIEDDNFDLDTSQGEEKERLFESRASKTWRTLRIAAKSRFSVFDKLDDGNKLDILFASPEEEKPAQAEDHEGQSESKDEDHSQDKAKANNGLDGAPDMHDEKTQASTEDEVHNPTHEAGEAPPEQNQDMVEPTKEDSTAVKASFGETQGTEKEVVNPSTVEDGAIT